MTRAGLLLTLLLVACPGSGVWPDQPNFPNDPPAADTSQCQASSQHMISIGCPPIEQQCIAQGKAGQPYPHACIQSALTCDKALQCR